MERDKEKGLVKYLSGIWNSNPFKTKDPNRFGTLKYWNGSESNLSCQNSNAVNFNILISGQQPVQGLHIPSHRPVFVYRQVGAIPTTSPSKQSIFELYRSHIMRPFQGGYTEKPSNLLMKETLIGLALFGAGNTHVSPNREAEELFIGFQSLLSKVLPEELGFEKIHIENPEVMIITKSGRFALDASSGGIAAIIDLVWQIYMGTKDGSASVVTIDEPENHLHPKLQRLVLPNLVKAFPNTQFIVVTHNPFVVTSMPDSNVYVLDFDENNKVFSRKLDLVNRAGDSNETLRNVLGLPSASPLWVEEKIGQIVQRYAGQTMDQVKLDTLRAEMKSLGLDDVFPKVLSEI
jgi:hypothetical protein